MPDDQVHPRWLRTVQVVAGTQFVALIGFGFSFPFLPLLIQELGITDRGELALWSGLAIGISGLAMAVASPIWGLLADRYGRKNMLVRSFASGSAMLLLQSVVNSVQQLVALRIFHGVFTGTQTAGAMLVAGVAPKERTGFAFGMMNTAVQIGNLAGPVLGGIAVVALGLRASFLVGAVLLGACVVVVVLLAEDVPISQRADAGVGVRGALRDVVTPFAWPALRGVLIISTLVQMVYASTVGLIAIYVQDFTRPPWLSVELTIGLAIALGSLSAAIAMPVLGGWADHHDPRPLLAVSLALVGLALIPQALIANALVFLTLRFVVGIGIAGMTSAIAVLTRTGAPIGDVGRAFGAFAGAQSLGAGVGPIVGSAFAAAAGIPALYFAGAVISLLLAPAALLMHSWFPVPDAVGEYPPPLVARATLED